MKGRIVVDVADDNGILMQVAFLKNGDARSSVMMDSPDQLDAFSEALDQIKNQAIRNNIIPLQ